MKVVYFEEQGFATSTIAPALRQEFGSKNVTPILPHQLHSSDVIDADLLVLPGITSEDSPYPKILPPEKAKMLYEKMEDGLIIIAECAAFYWSSSHISYLTSDGRKLEKQGLGWVDGIARGPSGGKGIAPDNDFKYADTIPADIEFYDGDKTLYTSICISNGPALHLTDIERNNPNVRITSRFISEFGQPVSSMSKTIGNGMLVGMGVLPHIKAANLKGRQTNPTKELHRSALFNRIAANEHHISRFERLIFDQIKAHHSNTALLRAEP